MHDARAVANFFLDRAEQQGLGLTSMTLLKVMYFAHGWHLARTSQPLVAQPFEAWKYGPVCRVVYDQIKQNGRGPVANRMVSLNVARGAFEPTLYTSFDVALRDFLSTTFDYYARFHAYTLSDLTHEVDGPWDQVWRKASSAAVAGMIIPNEAIAEWFCANRQLRIE